MTALTFYELLGDVDEQLVCAARPERMRRRRIPPLLLAAVLALLLAGFSEATRGSVSNLFAPLYGSSRTEIIDGVGRPVNASAAAGGYTVTAEAVVGDRYNFAIVYTLTEYAISKVQLSPFSVHVKLTTANPSAGYTWEEYKAAGRPGNEQEYLPDFTVELKLKDGVEPPWIGKNVSGHSTNGEPTQKNTVNAHFGVPVLPEDVEAIILCGTEIPVK